MAAAAPGGGFIDDACEADHESDVSVGETVYLEEIERGVQSLLTRANDAMSAHNAGEDVVDQLRLLSATAFPDMRDDLRALENPPPIHRAWLDSLAVARSSVLALCPQHICPTTRAAAVDVEDYLGDAAVAARAGTLRPPRPATREPLLQSMNTGAATQ
jgi:hypothetical protein